MKKDHKKRNKKRPKAQGKKIIINLAQLTGFLTALAGLLSAIAALIKELK
ncbi:hypothetical protein [Deinococcus kurensis]|nr:hypothetical protein [Deinococcus kurensis]